MSDSKALVPSGAAANSAELTTAIVSFEDAILDEAHRLGLPADKVVVTQRNRMLVLRNMGDVIEQLPSDRRGASMYLSKFMVAVGAGLLDAALNYLWDETIGELRRRIIDYDLQYFFDQAATDPAKRNELDGPEDLEKVTDDELIRSAARIGFISDLGFHQLDLVRHMRNHASAAHPNQHELTPFALLGYLETCIKEVITLPESPTMIETSSLLRNIKAASVTQTDARRYESLFAGLRKEQAEVLAKGLFGIYVSPQSSNVARDNVRALFPGIWALLADDTKSGFGVRYARYKANMDDEQARYARELLEALGAGSYLPEDVRVMEIDEILDRLIEVHGALNNFYKEPPLAKELRDYIGDQPVPSGVEQKYVQTLVEVFLGRRSGIAWGADPVYRNLLDAMSPEQAAAALHFASGPTVSAVLESKSPQTKMDDLLAIIGLKLVSRSAKALYEAILGFTGGYANLYQDTQIKRLRDQWEKSL